MPADFERRMATHQSHDNFLLHYARLMLTEDLLLFTNVAFVRPIEYLVPFAKLNKLSFISVMVHLPMLHHMAIRSLMSQPTPAT